MSRRKFIITSALISALVIAIPFVCNESLECSYYSITTDKLASPVRAAFISDLHNTKYGRDMSGLIGAVDSFEPDIVIFGGDFFDAGWAESNSMVFATEMQRRYPCFYSLGNHEFKKGEQNAIKTGMSKLGITVLDGKYSDVTVNGETVRIMGIDSGMSRDQLESCKNALDKDIFCILLEHYPEDFPFISEFGFDLVLSGHAHGGQWRLPPLINGVYSPGEGFFPKYTSGIYSLNGSEMLVSRGLQRCPRDLVIPRIFNRPEAVFITIG